MAAPKHGLVGSSKLKPAIAGAGKKSTNGMSIRSPQLSRDIVP